MSDTPETDAEELHEPYLVNELPFCVVRIDFARRLERGRNKAREQLASEKATRNAIIAKGIETELQRNEAQKAFAIATDQLVQVQGELRQAREENARLREALQANLFHHALACVWRHQDGTFDDKARVTEDSCQCPPKTKAFRKLLGTNSENKGFDP